MKVQAQTHEHEHRHDDVYDEFITNVNQRVISNSQDGKNPLFRVNVDGLWDAYLNAFIEDKQYHNCNTCKHFIRRYGNLVTIDEEGKITSAVWDLEDTPEMYKPSVKAMLKLIKKAKVSGVFLSSLNQWGHHHAGEWSHFHVYPTKGMIYSPRNILTAGQKIAQKGEDFKTVQRALNSFTIEAIEQAVRVLKSDALYRSEKVLGAGEWLLKVSSIRGNSNLVWKAVATAPDGFCHPRSSMIGTLLEDIQAGLSFDDVSRKFKAKMHPLQYQRPQAAPKADNIAEAEKIIAALGIEKSLQRRFARLEDIQTLWQSQEIQEAKPNGVFGHLKPKDVKQVEKFVLPSKDITWEKFREKVLPEALKIEYRTINYKDNYGTFVTANDSEAPNILQWDNPVSWYLYHGGSSPTSFNLPSNVWVKVNAIALRPNQWEGEEKHAQHGQGGMFILDGCKDTRNDDIALFPEMLKADLRAIRATIEAFSKSQKMHGKEEASAAGVLFAKNDKYNMQVRVTTKDGVQEYKIDRWE
jgi:hypothetical protein